MKNVLVIVTVLFAAGVSQAVWTWNETGTMIYDGAGVDSAINPYTQSTSDGDINIANSTGGVASLTVQSGTLTIKPQTSWADKVGHMPGTGTPAYDFAGAVTVENGATLTFYVNNDSEDRLVFGNNVRNGKIGRATVTLNGGTLNVIGDASFDHVERQVRLGSDGGIANLVLNAGTMHVSVNLPLAFGDKWTNNGTTWSSSTNASVSTMTINDGSLICSGSSIFGVGANDNINFISGGTGVLSILNWTTAEFQALATAGKIQIDGVDVTDLSQFVVVDGGSGAQGTLSLANKIILVAPENGATNVPIDQILEWTVIDPNVTHIDLYFYTQSDPNLHLAANRKLSHVAKTQMTYDPTITFGTTYYWSVDTYEPNGLYETRTPGGVWSFTTMYAQASVTPVSPAKTLADPDLHEDKQLSVIGTNATSYQWYKEGVGALLEGADYSGVQTNTLTIYDVQLADEGNYYCQVDNDLPLTDPVNSIPGSVMTKRLVIHYPLDEVTAGVTPDVVSGYDMTLVSDGGGADFPMLVGGKVGAGALLFNNSNAADPNNYWGQYATAGDVDVETMGEGFTLELWTNFAGSNGTTGGVVARRNTWGSGKMMWDVEMRPTGNVYVATNGTQTAEIATTQGHWTHLAITHDGVSTVRLYVNGEFRAQSTNLAFWGGVDSPLMLGAADYNAVTGLAANFFNGSIDDVKFYNYVRTSAEIAQDYLTVQGGWICNREAAALAYDYDGNCQIDLGDFAIFAAAWLESNRIYQQ